MNFQVVSTLGCMHNLHCVSCDELQLSLRQSLKLALASPAGY